MLISFERKFVARFLFLHFKTIAMEKKYLLLMLVFFIPRILLGSFIPGPGDEPLTIYPNPAKDQLKIELNIDQPVMPEIHILDLTGKVVLKFEQVFTREQQILKADLDISALKSGIYFVKVIQGKDTYTSKLMVR